MKELKTVFVLISIVFFNEGFSQNQLLTDFSNVDTFCYDKSISKISCGKYNDSKVRVGKWIIRNENGNLLGVWFYSVKGEDSLHIDFNDKHKPIFYKLYTNNKLKYVIEKNEQGGVISIEDYFCDSLSTMYQFFPSGKLQEITTRTYGYYMGFDNYRRHNYHLVFNEFGVIIKNERYYMGQLIR